MNEIEVMANGFRARRILAKLDEALKSRQQYLNIEKEGCRMQVDMIPPVKAVLQEYANWQNISMVEFVRIAFVEKMTRELGQMVTAGDAAGQQQQAAKDGTNG